MPQSKEVHREYMRKLRGSQEGSQIEGSQTEGSQYPAIIHALVNPDKRKKLEKIYQSLNSFKVADKVYYGCSKDSVPFDVVGELLEATK